MTVKIVADSACDVPEHLAQTLGITIVPVYINVGETSFREGVDISREEFYRNLPNYPVYPTTAAPATGVFTAVYNELTAAGATDIISIHIASSISATYNAARLGAEASEANVTIFDSEQITMGSGLQVIAAAEANVADDGGGSDPWRNRSLLHSCTRRIGRKVDRHIAVGRRKRAGGADRTAVLDCRDGTRQVDDRLRGAIVTAGFGGD